MNTPLLIAGIVSFGTFLIHTFVGGAEIADPLMETTDLQEIPKLTAYYCWHMVTLLLFSMSCAYLYVAIVQPALPLTIVMTGLSGACGVLSAAMVIIRKLKPLDYPQWILLLTVALFGVLGTVA